MKKTFEILLQVRGGEVDLTPSLVLFYHSLMVAGVAASAGAALLMRQKWFREWLESQPIVNEPDPDAWWIKQ